MRASALASALGGRLHGPDRELRGIASLHRAGPVLLLKPFTNVIGLGTAKAHHLEKKLIRIVLPCLGGFLATEHSHAVDLARALALLALDLLVA